MPIKSLKPVAHSEAPAAEQATKPGAITPRGRFRFAPSVSTDFARTDDSLSHVGRADGDRWAILAGLRFILAVIVMCHHLSSMSPTRWVGMLGLGNGFAAVLSFFVISGYSMAHSLSKETGGALAFYERRFWRIYPAYLFSLVLAALPVILFATVFTHAPMGFADSPSRNEFIEGALFLQGFTMPGTIPANGVTWSLSIEVWLYALCPLFIRLRGRALFGLLALSALLNFAHNQYLGNTYNADSYGTGFLSLAWPFLLGFAMYRYRQEITGDRLSLILVAALAIGCIDLQSSEYYGSFVFIAVIAAVYYCTRISLPPRLVKPLLWLGDLSFCLYLVHVPVMDMARGFDYHNGTVIAALCLAFAALTLYCVDYPIRAYRRWCRRAADARAALGAA